MCQTSTPVQLFCPLLSFYLRDNRGFLSAHIQSLQFPEEGKQEITSHSIEVLLCDIEMPGENGLALIRWIRESGYDIDCILLTCHADFNYAREAITLNCRDYLLLPAKYEEIGECVLNICRRREERLQAKQLELYGQHWLKDKDETIQERMKLERTFWKHREQLPSMLHLRLGIQIILIFLLPLKSTITVHRPSMLRKQLKGQALTIRIN